jgi:pimeloyl-ACP methyl ester carboxylesterase
MAAAFMQAAAAFTALKATRSGGVRRMALRLPAAMLALLLSACVTYPDISQSRSPCRMEPGGWCAFLREAAIEAWPYAVASTNAYAGDNDLFGDTGPLLERLERLPIAPEDAKKGFGYQIFAQYAPGSAGNPGRVPTARIMAFRGTDFDGFTDVFYGTVRDDQIALALRYFAAERERWGNDAAWIVTGHSLGGALATEVSVAYPEVRAYMFNTSPFHPSDAIINRVQRTVFNERGEVLRRFSRFDVDPAAAAFTINCRPQKGTFAKHRVRPLADCITWIAAYGSEDALAVVRANAVAKPVVECGPDDKAHPGRQRGALAACVHVARRDKPKAP